MYEGKVALAMCAVDERGIYRSLDVTAMAQKPDFSHFYDYNRDDGTIGFNRRTVPGDIEL